MTKQMTEEPTRPPPPQRYPEGTTPEQVAGALGFVPPHQRPEVIRERERREKEAEANG